MLKAPNFWYNKNTTFFSIILYPASILFRILTKIYVIICKTKTADIPVICIGNLVVGGAGKTPVALKMGEILKLSGYNPHFLTRGYSGSIKENIQVTNKHSPDDVGDESLILASIAPTWIGSNRIKSSKLAAINGADCIIMDDGFQNPNIKKDFSIIVIDGKQGFGNRKVLPAGPLRESVTRGLKRANAVILVGKDEFGIKKFIDYSMPFFNADFDVSKNEEIYRGKDVTAFAGIAYPTKFFDTLKKQGANIYKSIIFPDHHIYTENDILKLIEIANKNKSILVTTKKDFVRIPNNYKTIIHKLEGEINLEKEDILKKKLTDLLEDFIFKKDTNHENI
tara:strand:+ start:6082 stop:7095 length:1014 start_codon:yes stop_codon:yes gene_type:complete